MRLPNSTHFKFVKDFDVDQISKRISELDDSVWLSNPFNTHLNFPKEILLRIEQLKKQMSVSRIWIKCTEEDWLPNRLRLDLAQYIDADLDITADNFGKYIKKFKTNQVDNQLNSYTDAIVNELEQIYDGVAARILYAKISPGSGIAPHSDNGYYFQHSHRCHVPIITNDNVFFTIEDDSFNLPQGKCYEVDNILMHHVRNLGNTDRIHLIVDIIPKDQYPL